MSTPSFLPGGEPLTVMAAKFWPQRHGGVESHLWHMASTMARMKQPVRVLTENRDQLAPHEMVIPHLHVRRFDSIHFGKLWRWPHAVQVKWWMQVLKQDRPRGWIWATQPCMALAAAMAGMRDQLIFNPACCVAAMRDIGRQHTHVNTMHQPRLSQWIERLAYNASPRVVVSSENLAQQFRQHHRPHANMQVLPLATHPRQVAVTKTEARKQWNIPDGATTIGFVGRLDPCKDLDMLLRAASNCFTRQQGRDKLRLLIVGDGPDKDRLTDHAVRLGMSDQIIWTGDLHDPAHAYAAMDALALTSVYEAFGLVILEAMASGVPVLGRRSNSASVLTACDEIITHGVDGLLFQSLSTSSLSRAIDALASLPVLQNTLAAGARRKAENSNWDNYARRCLTLLDLSQTPALEEAPPRLAA